MTLNLIKRSACYVGCGLIAVLLNCTTEQETSANELKAVVQPVHQDKPFIQDFSVKFYLEDAIGKDIALQKSYCDRNGVIQVLSSKGLLRTHAGEFLYPGILQRDGNYHPMADKELRDMAMLQHQFVYLDNQAVFSNAWAGSLFVRHGLPNAKSLAVTEDMKFLVSDGKRLKYLDRSGPVWEGMLDGGNLLDIRYAPAGNDFWVLTSTTLYTYSPGDNLLVKKFEGRDFTSMSLTGEKTVIIGTHDGYLTLESDGKSLNQTGKNQKLPWNEITAVSEINGKLWFGSTRGAFMLREDGGFNYYYGERWLPGNEVIHISQGADNSILILTDAGLGQINFKEMTLYEKAMYFEDQVRQRHIRHGFNSGLVGMEKGNIDSGVLKDSDNDGLWTSMYLAAEAFRYAVTKSEVALQNCRESLDAMERLYSINPVPGFPSRSFERSGYIEKLSDPERWQHSQDPEWDWKATTSSDEAIGHIFVFGVMAEIIDDEDIRSRSVNLIDTLMSHILKNDMYLVDYDGKPTTWGRWHPEYVNARPIMVGDRKINASNIVGMLQTAYHFTGKEKYREKAAELMLEYGYLENLMRPMNQIGSAPEDADDWSKMLSESWNHSDDEMYFLGYWGLYRYAFNDSLKALYKDAIIDHWEAERPEKEGAWNIFTALTGAADFDLEEAVWYLQQHPMDLIDWEIMNSHRKDIVHLEDNFRGQTIEQVLPPDERPVQRHNGNMFRLDRAEGNGVSEHSAGDIWLLPYWMGRYLGVISEPMG